MDRWAPIDKRLSGLVDRLRTTGYHHTLEVELRFARIGDEPGNIDLTKFMSEFREKGVVTITDAARGDRVFCSSAHHPLSGWGFTPSPVLFT